MLIKVKDNENLARDNASKAILNVNVGALEAFKAKKAEQEKLNSAINNYEKLKEEIDVIKNTLQLILAKLG